MFNENQEVKQLISHKILPKIRKKQKQTEKKPQHPIF